MEFIGKKIAGMTVRAWLCLALLGGSCLVILGTMDYLKGGGWAYLAVLGGLVCLASILAGAATEK